MWQAEHVAALLRAVDSELTVELVPVSTTGDRLADRPIHELGGKGVFVKEVQAAVLDGRADIAVHSAKDMPAVGVEGLSIAAVPSRGDVRDALVGSSLDGLEAGATVATGSARRRVQLAELRPDLRFEELRGNIATRLAKAPGFGAIVMAAVALERLGVKPPVVELLSTEQMIPQVGQGALAVECRTDDGAVAERLAAVDHPSSSRRLTAERAFLAELGGDCTLPAGALAELDGDEVELSAMLADDSGRVSRRRNRGSDPDAIGGRLAAELRAEIS